MENETCSNIGEEIISKLKELIEILESKLKKNEKKLTSAYSC
jgi:hypothetical protein